MAKQPKSGSGGRSRQTRSLSLTVTPRPLGLSPSYREGNQYVFRTGASVSKGRAEAIVGTTNLAAMERASSVGRPAVYANRTLGSTGWMPKGHDAKTKREIKLTKPKAR